MVRTFSKPAGQGLATEVEIQTLLEGLLQEKALSFSNFLEGDSAVVIS